MEEIKKMIFMQSRENKKKNVVVEENERKQETIV